MASRRSILQNLSIAGGLFILTLFAFWPVIHFDFVNYDDLPYVTENPMVQQGLTWDMLRWAATATHASNWHPLTWVSHALDCSMYGPSAGGHHLTSLLIHATNVVLVFAVLYQMTGARWRSGVVAALFACHPLRIESVAWIAERKDVLSTLFLLLAIMAYFQYVSASASGGASWRRGSPSYLAALFFFAAGLMCKPMIVTLPFVLLLLDYWPLRRLSQAAKPFAILFEKAPFLILSLGACIITYIVQKGQGAVVPLKDVSVSMRVGNACVSYFRYLQKAFWPTQLSPLYPYVFHWPGWLVVIAAAGLAALTGIFVWRAKDRPYLAVGWLWYLGMLIPVIGLVQVGSQSMADRYTYVPLIGIFIIVTWAAADTLARLRYSGTVLTVLATLGIASCLAVTREQIWHWKNAESLFRHAVAVDARNAVAHNNLGCALLLQHRVAEARDCFRTAIQQQMSCGDAYVNLGWILAGEGKYQEAFENYQNALLINTNDVSAHVRMGKLLVAVSSIDEGIGHLLTAVRLNPVHVDALNDLGIAYSKKNQPDEALRYFRAALKLRPAYPEALNNVGNILAVQNNLAAAEIAYNEAIRLKPDYVNARYNLADVLARSGRTQQAVELLQSIIQAIPDDAGAYNRLAEVLFEQGQGVAALQACDTAIKLDPQFQDAFSNRAWILAVSPDPNVHNGAAALRAAERALELGSNGRARALDSRAAAFAAVGDFARAVDSELLAVEYARGHEPARVDEFQSRLALYQSGKVYLHP